MYIKPSGKDWFKSKVLGTVDHLVTSLSQTKFDSSIRGMKNYSSARITGSANHRASNITDHAASEQHKVAMLCL